MHAIAAGLPDLPRDEALEEHLDHRVEADSRQAGHVQHLPDGRRAHPGDARGPTDAGTQLEPRWPQLSEGDELPGRSEAVHVADLRQQQASGTRTEVNSKALCAFAPPQVSDRYAAVLLTSSLSSVSSGA
jgi:hypothetical protein